MNYGRGRDNKRKITTGFRVEMHEKKFLFTENKIYVKARNRSYNQGIYLKTHIILVIKP